MTSLYKSESRFLRVGLEQLKDYLLSNELFWNLGLPSKYPQFTLGNLLLSAAQLGAASGLSAAQNRERQELLAELERQKKEWRSAWESKTQREFASRLQQWGQYLDELGQSPGQQGGYFKSEARQRALLELLIDELPPSEHVLKGELTLLDQRLRRYIEDGDFIWDKSVKEGFPKGRYWFLYARPKAT